MRKIFNYALSALFLMSVMTACDNKQSELTMDSITGSATISGTVEYNDGTYKDADGNMVSEHKVPAVGQKVIATIDNNNYGGGAQGHKVFTAIVDAQGNYKLTVPVAVSREVTVEISVAPFKASNSTLNENNEIKADTSVVYILEAPETVTVKDGVEEFVVDLVLIARNEAEVKGIVTGSVTYDEGAFKQSNNSVISQHIIPATGKSVKFTDEDGKYYTAVVDADGKYEIALPIGNYTAEVVPFKATKSITAVTGNEVVAFPNSIFSGSTENVSVGAGTTTTDIDFMPTAEIEEKMVFDKAVEIIGEVKIHQARVRNDLIEAFWAPANGRKIEIVVEFDDTENPGEKIEMIYRTTLGADGKYSFTAMLPTDFKDMNTKAYVRHSVEKTTTTFPYREPGDDWDDQIVEVLTVDGEVSGSIAEKHTLVPLELSDLQIDIEPVDLDTVHGFEDDTDYEYNNPLGW